MTTRNDLVHQVKFMVSQAIRKSLQHTATHKLGAPDLFGRRCMQSGDFRRRTNRPLAALLWLEIMYIRHTLAKLLHFSSISAKANLVLGSCFPPLPLSAMSPSVSL